MKKSMLREMIKEELLKESRTTKDTLNIIIKVLKRAGMEVTVEGSHITIDPKSGGEPAIELQWQR
jgi:hypothetical protein